MSDIFSRPPMKLRDWLDVFWMTIGFIFLFLAICSTIYTCVDRYSRNEDLAHKEPIQQAVPFEK